MKQMIIKESTIVLLAFLVASIVPSIYLAIFESVTTGNLPELFWVLILIPFSFSFMVIIAVPMYLILNRFKLVNFWTVLLSGLLVGFIVSFVVRGYSYSNDLALFIPASTSAAFVFWCIKTWLEKYASNIVQ